MRTVDLDLANSILQYNQDTGEFIWKIQPNSKVPKGAVAGTIRHPGYILIGIQGKMYYAHRLAWAMFYGKWPENNIDHKNGIRHDNRIKNLRECTQTENNRNHGWHTKNTSGLKGASFHKSSGKWRATIRINGKSKHLGSFDSIEKAHECYCEAAKKYFGEFYREV